MADGLEDLDIGVLAGGDIYEWAVEQVAIDVQRARERLHDEYPHIFPLQKEHP